VRNKRTWQIFLLSIAIFAALSHFLPIFRDITELLSLALSVTSILFGLLIGFFITQMWNKFTAVRRESAIFRSALLGMITNMRRLEGNDKVKEEFENRMEKFLIAFTMISWDSVEEEERYFEVVTNTISDVTLFNDRDSSIYTQLLDAESSAGSARSQLSSIGKEGLMKLEWAVLIILSSIITVSVLLLRDGSLFFQTLSSLLPPLLLLTMMMLDDLDHLRWGATIVSFEPAQEALEAINKQRFYESRYIEKGWVEEPETYRTEKDLEGDLKDVYDELKLKDCLREDGILGPKL
jgi:hypothetical protein